MSPGIQLLFSTHYFICKVIGNFYPLKVRNWHKHDWPFIIVVIITWTSEKPSQKNNSDITVIWVSDWFKWVDLFKISSLMSQFSTNKRTLSVFCCFLFAVFSNMVYSTSLVVAEELKLISINLILLGCIFPGLYIQFQGFGLQIMQYIFGMQNASTFGVSNPRMQYALQFETCYL